MIAVLLVIVPPVAVVAITVVARRISAGRHVRSRGSFGIGAPR